MAAAGGGGQRAIRSRRGEREQVVLSAASKETDVISITSGGGTEVASFRQPPSQCGGVPEGCCLGSPYQVITVLVVDDERVARRIATRILTEEGFRVLEADGAAEAVEVLGQARGRVDLVMLDVVMPGTDGVELTETILAEWPDQRLLYMSAYPAEILVKHGLKDLDVPFLRQALYPRRAAEESEISVAPACGPAGGHQSSGRTAEDPSHEG